ncbi:hypothetical protein CT19431_MP80177 [Cupriavidus taiwanensis]|nr:hypothetical protein CT19431_MP80177 [Cupriavidus taiwanensis]
MALRGAQTKSLGAKPKGRANSIGSKSGQKWEGRAAKPFIRWRDVTEKVAAILPAIDVQSRSNRRATGMTMLATSCPTISPCNLRYFL